MRLFLQGIQEMEGTIMILASEYGRSFSREILK
jgi:hypothetical protein